MNTLPSLSIHTRIRPLLRRISGFTLIELLVVIAIIAILVVIALVAFGSAPAKARDAKRRASADALAKALELKYNPETGLYADVTAADFSRGGADVLNSTTSKVTKTIAADNKSFRVCADLETMSGTEDYCVGSSLGGTVAPAAGGGGGGTALTHTASFTTGVIPTATQSDSWVAYRGTLASKTFTSVTLSGSQDTTGVTCTGAPADQLCDALASGASVTVLCDTRNWHVGDCGGVGRMEINADGSFCGCTGGTTGYALRPSQADANWGGIKGTTCSAPSQTITLTCQQ